MSESIFQRLSDSEINFEVASFWDGGFDVRLGDAVNGFIVQDQVRTWDEVEQWLRTQALAHFPNSGFAKRELGATWKPVDHSVMPFSQRQPRR